MAEQRHGTVFAEQRIRTLLAEVEPGTHNLGAELVYSDAFRSEEWPRGVYALDRTDMEALFALLDRARSWPPQVWSVSGPREDFVERFATRELAQAAAEIAWCNENNPEGSPAFAWTQDEPDAWEAYIDGMALEWQVRAEPLIWSRPDDDAAGGA